MSHYMHTYTATQRHLRRPQDMRRFERGLVGIFAIIVTYGAFVALIMSL